MNRQLLLPHRFKSIGWILLVPATLLGLYITIGNHNDNWLPAQMPSVFEKKFMGESAVFAITDVDLTNTLVGIAFIAGALMVGFSREKTEDEFISGLRLSSLLWAVWLNYILLTLAFLFVWNFSFMNVMLYNMFTVLIIFIARFNFILYRNRKMASDEK